MPELTSVNLYMRQGVVVDLKSCQLSSNQFGSCAPVVFFNKKTGQGALYHMPGLDSPEKIAVSDVVALKDLCKQVEPTHVYILTGGGDMDMKNPKQSLLTLGHIPAIQKIVKENAPKAEITCTVPGEQVDKVGSPGLKTPRKLTESEIEEFELQSVESVTSVSGLSISANEHGIRFHNELPKVDLSLDTSEQVAMLMVSTKDTECFAGLPDGNPFGEKKTTLWKSVEHNPKKLGLDEELINSMRPLVLEKTNTFLFNRKLEETKKNLLRGQVVESKHEIEGSTEKVLGRESSPVLGKQPTPTHSEKGTSVRQQLKRSVSTPNLPRHIKL